MQTDAGFCSGCCLLFPFISCIYISLPPPLLQSEVSNKLMQLLSGSGQHGAADWDGLQRRWEVSSFYSGDVCYFGGMSVTVACSVYSALLECWTGGDFSGLRCYLCNGVSNVGARKLLFNCISKTKHWYRNNRQSLMKVLECWGFRSCREEGVWLKPLSGDRHVFSV